MTVEVIAKDDWRSAVDPVLLQLFDPPDFELRIAEYPEMTGTWRTTSALLTPRAEAGDPEAQYLLYRAAHRCFHAPRTLDELEAKLARAERWDGPFHMKPDVAPGQAQLRATYEFCADSTREETGPAIDWVIAAADAGNIRAQIAYSETHFPGDDRLELDYPFDDEEVAFIEERRARSRAYLERAKAAGSVDAMVRLFNFHLSFPADAYNRSIDPTLRDPGSAAARAHRQAAVTSLYAPAWFVQRDRGGAHPGDGALRIVQRLGAQMPAHEYQEAIERGRAILGSENCCLKFRDIK